jgi:hypothetical protein
LNDRFTDLGRVTQVWNNAARAQHVDVPVHEPRWRRLFSLGGELLKTVRDPELQQAVRSLMYRLGSLPLPLTDPASWPNADPERFFRLMGTHSSSEQSGTARELVQLLEELMAEDGTHPFWSKVWSIWPSLPKPSCLFCVRKSHVQRLQPYASTLPDSPVVLVPDDLDEMSFRASAVAFGPPRSYPAWMKSMPHVPTYWIRFAWNSPATQPESFLPYGRRSAPRFSLIRLGEEEAPEEPSTDTGRWEPQDLSDPIDWRSFPQRLRDYVNPVDQEDGEGCDVVPAVAGVISDDEVVLLPLESRTTVFDPDTREVRGLLGGDIRPGMFVIVREGRGRDHIRQLVEDRFLTNAEEARGYLRTWKRALRQEIKLRGIDRVTSELSRRGVTAVAETVRSWTTDLVHGPGRHDWFEALLEYLVVDDVAKHWNVVQAYRQAGRAAGRFVRDALLAQVEHMDIETASRENVLTFSLEGVEGGSLKAHRIEEVRTDQLYAHADLLGRVLDMGDASWRG